MTSDERVILCMKWGTKYGPEYVNRLYGMVRRHLKGDFRFVCLTDRSEGIRAEVQCLPIPAGLVVSLETLVSVVVVTLGAPG